MEAALTLLGVRANGLADCGSLIGREYIRNLAIVEHVVNILHKRFVFNLGIQTLCLLKVHDHRKRKIYQEFE